MTAIESNRIPVAFLALLLTAGCGGKATISDVLPQDAGMNENDAQAGGQGGSAGSGSEGAAGVVPNVASTTRSVSFALRSPRPPLATPRVVKTQKN
jgi:hypothetical protein